ncbi:MAG: SCO2525 family SAM-dependent methyltransferase [Micromonosporaceae bacterium]
MTRRGRNADYEWDQFDSAWYHRHNYSDLRWDDREIIEYVGDFFTEAYRKGRLGSGLRGVDVGAGANLYPSLAMLPFCRTIELFDFSESNIRWLVEQVPQYGPSWDPFWNTLARRGPHYHAVACPRRRLAEIARVARDSVFKLPERQWDVGTMFFVAESLTSVPTEFKTALRRFVLGLKRRAPFAAAFMRGSKGYRVHDRWFPAVAIDEAHVEECLEPLTTDLRLHKVALGERLRPGYDGMILATGYRSNQT